MADPLGPSANEVKHHFVEDGERILGIDDASLAAASPPPAPAKRTVSRRMLYLLAVGLLVLFMAAGGACFFTQALLQRAVGPEEDGPPLLPGATSGGAPSDAAGSGAHNETAPGHVDQSWKPTYVKVGTWEIALARQRVLTSDYTPEAGNAKEGSTFVLVSLFVVNQGAADAELTAGCFAAEAAGASYPLKGYTAQTARAGNPVAIEAAFEVPHGTPDLVVTFTPPDGGGTAELPLPEVRY